MSSLRTNTIDLLNKISSTEVKKFKSEKEFETFVFQQLDSGLNRKFLLKTQDRSKKRGRQKKPDISIGKNEILIELKFNIKSINDIYRLFYQSIKYSLIAKESVILFIYDPKRKLLSSDIKDLEKIEKVKVICLH